MRKDLKKEYTVRISQSNRTQLVVVVYDILLEYLKGAQHAEHDGDMDLFIAELKNAQNSVAELMGALDFKYPVSRELFQIYLFWNRQLIKAIVKKDIACLDGLDRMAVKLKQAFEELSKSDHSQPLMQNSQKVYAGLTYGRGELSEMMDLDYNRGFQA